MSKRVSRINSEKSDGARNASPRSQTNSRRPSVDKNASRDSVVSEKSAKGAKSPARPTLMRRRSSVTFKDAPAAVTSTEEDFIGTVNAQSTKQDIGRVVNLLIEAAEAKDLKLIRTVCQAIVRVCENRKGFNKFLKAQGIDAIIKAAQLPQKQGGEAAMRASRPICAAASNWMDEVDEVEFTELPDLMNMARQLGVFDEGVAVSALCAMERFGLHRREHAAAMLEAGALTVLHQIVNAHRNPELLQDALILLYRLCDLPAESVLPVLTEELELVKTVSEALSQSPLNMKLQLSGLRLLTLWSKMGDRKVNNAIARVSAQAAVQRAEGDLMRSGFEHTASWLNAVAGRSLAGAMPTAPSD